MIPFRKKETQRRTGIPRTVRRWQKGLVYEEGPVQSSQSLTYAFLPFGQAEVVAQVDGPAVDRVRRGS